MSSETPTDQSPSDAERTQIIARRQEDYLRFKHYAAVTCLIASPILVALPPRRLNSIAVIQVSAFGMSANYLIRERTGKSIVGHLGAQIAGAAPTQDLPSERAQAIQAKMRAVRDAKISDENTPAEELEKLQARQRNDKGFAERLWLGNESGGWKERRMQEEQKALAEGKGYGDLIKEYISDAWGWGKKDQGDSNRPQSKDGSQ